MISLLAGSALPLILACAPTPRSGTSASVRGPVVGEGPPAVSDGGEAAAAEGDEQSAEGQSAEGRSADSLSAESKHAESKHAESKRAESKHAESKRADASKPEVVPAYDSKSEGKAEGTSSGARRSDYDSKSERRPDEEGKPYYESKAYYESKRAAAERPRGAHEAPVARRDDFGPPGQETPLAVVAAYLAAADANDRPRALAVMTAKCAERERTWSRSFSTAIFDRGHRFHVVRLGEENTEENTAEIRLRVVFLDYEGKPDNEGMRLTLIRRDGLWWLDELR